MITFEDIKQGGRLEGKFEWSWHVPTKHFHARVRTHSFSPCGVELGFGLLPMFARHPVCPKCMEWVIAEAVLGKVLGEVQPQCSPFPAQVSSQPQLQPDGTFLVIVREIRPNGRYGQLVLKRKPAYGEILYGE